MQSELVVAACTKRSKADHTLGNFVASNMKFQATSCLEQSSFLISGDKHQSTSKKTTGCKQLVASNKVASCMVSLRGVAHYAEA